MPLPVYEPRSSAHCVQLRATRLSRYQLGDVSLKENVPSGDRRRQKTGVCASRPDPPRDSDYFTSDFVRLQRPGQFVSSRSDGNLLGLNSLACSLELY